MEIRKKLSYQFLAIVALILFLSSLTIYLSFSGIRRDNFFDRLGSKATMVAQMLIEFDEIDADLLKKLESKNPLSLPNEKIIIYDYQNQVVYSNDEEKLLDILPEYIDEVRLNGDIRFKQGAYEILGQFYSGQYDRYVVFAAATDIFGLGKLKRLLIILLIVFFLNLVIAFFTGRIFATRALQPISNIMAQAEAIGVSNLDIRISEGAGKDEIARLAYTFNRMLDRLELAFKTQKNFIANASHELRTPLTVITGQLEVTLLKSRSNDQYRNTIISLLDDIKNLNQISNRLLLLAQTSSELTGTGFEQIRIDDIIWQARNEVLKRNSEYRVPVHFSEEIDNELKLTVNGNEMLLKTALVNLIENGCKYSDDHIVEVHLSSSNTEVIINFTDRGIGIPEEEIDFIFQPFYRARNAIGFKGHGIGLSLVERIIIMHGGSITVSSKENEGTNICLRFQPLELS